MTETMLKTALLMLATSLLTACNTLRTPNVDIGPATTARPQPQSMAAGNSGSIFQDGSRTQVAYRPLFEDIRARYVGDTIVININEKVSATNSKNSSADKSGSVELTTPGVKGLLGQNINPIASAKGSSSDKFEGKGATSAQNSFTGTITATVIEVLPNGNLIVAGEKQIGLNQNVETVRIAGVVNPTTILAGNQVSSSQIADARIEYRGKGYMEEAQQMGWLSRFFLNVLPF